jgi:hypothetical protein
VAVSSPDNENKPKLSSSIVRPTVGIPWPAPKSMTFTKTAYALEPDSFQFTTTGQDCDIILDEAYRRYYGEIFSIHNDDRPYMQFARRRKFRPSATLSVVQELDVNVKQVCEKYPSLDMDESCRFCS